jgi:hypothetical protein
VQEVANEVGISKICHEILTENLSMQLVAAKSAPHRLNDKQTQRCLEVSQGLFDHANNDENFLKTSLQVFSYDVETKAHSPQQISKTTPRPK